VVVMVSGTFEQGGARKCPRAASSRRACPP
jgi:hypothetical protein